MKLCIQKKIFNYQCNYRFNKELFIVKCVTNRYIIYVRFIYYIYYYNIYIIENTIIENQICMIRFSIYPKERERMMYNYELKYKFN